MVEGRVLAGRYALGRLLGRGGMGEVWSGQDRLMQRDVAVKLLYDRIRAEGGADLFFREARTAGGLSHPGVVTVYDVGSDPDDGTLFLVMELLDGRDLAEVLRTDAPLPVDSVVAWAARAADALDAAHRAGIIHRDLKPANLMLTDRGSIKILDFGIARQLSAGTQTGGVVGTPTYIAPERWRDGRGDARADLYAFGCLLYELLTGKPPFDGPDAIALMYAHLETAPEPPGVVRPDVPPGLDRLVLSLLAKEPEDRPQDAAAVRDALRGGLQDDPGPSTVYAGKVESARTERRGAAPTTVVNPAAHPAPGGSDVPDTGHDGPSRRAFLRVGGAVAAVGAGAGVWAVLSRGGGQAGRQAGSGATPGPSTGSPAPTGSAAAPSSSPSFAPTPTPRVRLVRPWSVSLGTEAPVEPLVADGTFVTGTLNSDAAFGYAADTGAERWRIPDVDPGNGVATDGTAVYVGSRTDRTMRAYHARTGKPTGWTFTVERGDRAVNPLVAGDVVVVTGYTDVSNRFVLYGVDRVTARERWRVPDLTLPTPLLFDGVVYAVGGGKVRSISAATGTVHWTRAVTGEPIQVEATDSSVYVRLSSGNTSVVTALDKRTGDVKWEKRGGRDGMVLGPVEGNGLVYFCDDNGLIQGCDLQTLEPRWAFRGAEPTTVRVAAGGMVHLAYTDLPSRRGIAAVEMATESEIWSRNTTNAPAAVTLADGVLFVAVPDDSLYAFEPRGGSVMWGSRVGKTGQSLRVSAFGEAVYLSTEAGRIHAMHTMSGTSLGQPENTPTGG